MNEWNAGEKSVRVALAVKALVIFLFCDFFSFFFFFSWLFYFGFSF